MESNDAFFYTAPVVNRRDPSQLGTKRLDPRAFYRGRVHAGSVKGSQLPEICVSSGRGIPGCLRQHLSQGSKVLLLELIEAAPKRLVSGNLITAEPSAVGITEEVLARRAGGVHVHRTEGLRLFLS